MAGNVTVRMLTSMMRRVAMGRTAEVIEKAATNQPALFFKLEPDTELNDLNIWRHGLWTGAAPHWKAGTVPEAEDLFCSFGWRQRRPGCLCGTTHSIARRCST